MINLTRTNALRPRLKSFAGLQFLVMSLVMTIGILDMSAQKALSQKPLFYCAQLNGAWHTFKRTTWDDDYNFITWETWDFGISPRDRCIDVSNRFNSFYARGLLNDLAYGVYNRLPVVCAGWCADGRILYTVSSAGSVTTAASSLAQLQAIVASGFRSGRIYNSGYLDTDSVGNQYLVKGNGERVLLLKVISETEGVLYFERYLCEAIDPQDPSCP